MGECQICLKRLAEGDISYPLICPRACGFNMCTICVTHLVKTSVGKSSNNPPTTITTTTTNSHNNNNSNPIGRPNGKGGMRLQCPQCRGDIALTIEDTLLLRNAQAINELKGIPDSELNGAELRQKHSITAEEIQQAKLRLDQYVADIANGNVPKKKENDKTIAGGGEQQSDPDIDDTLLIGLGDAMTDAEKMYVTQLMTSGSANKLAQAAQILSEIERAVRKGQIDSAATPPSPGKKKDPKKDPKGKYTEAEKRALEMSMTTEERSENERKERHDRMYPLPDRMPRYVILKANFDVYAKHSKVIKFVDDGWDGSVADAYSRVHLTESEQRGDGGESLHGGGSDIDSDYSTTHSESGFDSDDDEGDNEEFINTNVKKYKNRVLIRKARRQAAKQGIQKGDVVSHLNGDEFKGTAADLRQAINQFYLSGNKDYTFSFTLNAEQSTAAALKLRAMVDGLMHCSESFV
eukprot:CAMPEP_0198256682 /NCGR_PEP_ID=MMETSP1447-20131203/6531_1 /TAXON_ID=420782 /ORGANISM="Chaetoceros dichaeta, Strain CCMP1751" /LENGTH=464 /DNA_ID=CAMNT_0043943377 /DNA_START=50 /DNA_END=1444 /DNA_ORIENTATION=-